LKISKNTIEYPGVPYKYYLSLNVLNCTGNSY